MGGRRACPGRTGPGAACLGEVASRAPNICVPAPRRSLFATLSSRRSPVPRTAEMPGGRRRVLLSAYRQPRELGESGLSVQAAVLGVAAPEPTGRLWRPASCREQLGGRPIAPRPAPSPTPSPASPVSRAAWPVARSGRLRPLGHHGPRGQRRRRRRGPGRPRRSSAT